MLDRYTSWVTRFKYPVIISTLIIMTGLCLGVKNTELATSFRAYFSSDNPQLLAFEEVEDEFNKQDSVFIYIEPKTGDIYNKETLKLIWALTEDAWQLPYAQRPISIANYQHTRADGDDLLVESLVEDPRVLNDAHIQFIKETINKDSQLKNSLTNDAGSATGVDVKMNLPEDNPYAAHELDIKAKALVEKYRKKYPNHSILLGGSSTMNAAISNVFYDDVGRLIVATYVIFCVMLLFMLRSIIGMLTTIVIILMASVSTFGIFTLAGAVFTPTQSFVLISITTIAIADVVHILLTYYYSLNKGVEKYEAIKESIRINAMPVLITSVSTAIGVLCLNFSDSPPYRLLGNMIAFGVMIAYLLSMFFLPAIMAALPQPKKSNRIVQNTLGQKLMTSFSFWVIKHYKKLLVIVGLFGIGMMYLVTKNEITEQWNEYFDETYEIRQVIDQVDGNLAGTHRLQYTVRSTQGDNGIYTPDYLKQLEAFSQWFKQQDKVGHVESIVPIIQRVNKSLHGDDEAYLRIPDSKEAAAQFFLMYEMSLPQGLGLDDLQNTNRSATRMSVVVHKSDSEALIALDNKATAWVKANAPALQVSEGSGLDLIFSHLAGRNIRQLIIGAGAGLVIISILMIFALRSVRMGILSLIPNLLPIVVAYGLWVFVKGEINLAVAVVMSISMGIVVDDTVHFMSKYLRARREQGLSVEEAITYAFSNVGVALMVTSIVLVAGFSVMLLAHFTPTKDLGVLMALAIGMAVFIDFLLLPPMLMLLDKKK